MPRSINMIRYQFSHYFDPNQARDPDCLEIYQERRPEIDMSQKLNQPSKLKLAKLERMLLKKKKRRLPKNKKLDSAQAVLSMCTHDDNALNRDSDSPMFKEWPISLHSSLPAKTHVIPMAVNGLPMVAGVEMGIAAVRGFQWIDWKCMYLQMGDYFRALDVQQEQEQEEEVSTAVMHKCSSLECNEFNLPLTLHIHCMFASQGRIATKIQHQLNGRVESCWLTNGPTLLQLARS